ncbi:glutathione S-transferase U19-like [Triticum dicoccoides]|uniref:glutathione S-transferase U19-like n=1 Tax=Triticum dicoccoides TaxID=85692 RepID=UPI00188E83DF|nr:glutathione S-transferase U19-like [Triticum dicoccoides]
MEKAMDAGRQSEVTCVDFWANEFGMRVRIALRELGVAFEYVEEDLRVRERSELVRRMNPVHRSIPILIHHGLPVCGSVNIIEYIDEVWGEARLLPGNPVDRADARFWADFVDHKVFGAQVRFLESKGEEKDELVEQLKRLEEVLGDKGFFSGDDFGFLDIVTIPFSSMFHGYEQLGRFDLDVECPKLTQWAKRCKQRESVLTCFELVSVMKINYDKTGVGVTMNPGINAGGHLPEADLGAGDDDDAACKKHIGVVSESPVSTLEAAYLASPFIV